MVGKRKSSEEQHPVTKLLRQQFEQQNELHLSTSGESSVSIALR